MNSSVQNHLPKVSHVWKMPEPIEKKRDYSYHPPLSMKGGIYARSSLLAVPVIATATGIATQGVFWDTFLTYIFPWFLDIAKVFCAIKIAQGFYQEKRGGRDNDTGMGSMVTYGKWLLLFHLIPWGVTLIDQIGSKMFTDLQNQQ